MIVKHRQVGRAQTGQHVDHEAMSESARNAACLGNLSRSIPRAQLPKETDFFTSRVRDQQPSPLATFLRDSCSELEVGKAASIVQARRCSVKQREKRDSMIHARRPKRERERRCGRSRRRDFHAIILHCLFQNFSLSGSPATTPRSPAPSLPYVSSNGQQNIENTKYTSTSTSQKLVTISSISFGS